MEDNDLVASCCHKKGSCSCMSARSWNRTIASKCPRPSWQRANCFVRPILDLGIRSSFVLGCPLKAAHCHVPVPLAGCLAKAQGALSANSCEPTLNLCVPGEEKSPAMVKITHQHIVTSANTCAWFLPLASWFGAVSKEHPLTLVFLCHLSHLTFWLT